MVRRRSLEPTNTGEIGQMGQSGLADALSVWQPARPVQATMAGGLLIRPGLSRIARSAGAIGPAMHYRCLQGMG